MNINDKEKLYRLTQAAMLVALSFVMLLIIRFPIFPAAPYLEYDMADVPILFGTLFISPMAGISILAVVSLLQAFFLGGNGIIGFIMHFVASGLLVVAVGYIYKHYRTIKSLIIGFIIGSLLMTLSMIPLNLILTPLLFKIPVEAVKELIIPIIIPFNLIKAFANSLITFWIFIPAKKYLRKFII